MSATAPATADAIAPPIEPPLGLLAELTHRCPLRCPYCSNPEALTRAAQELDTATWARVFREELDRLVAERGIRVHNVVGDHTTPEGRELLSPAHVRELVPDVVEREVYLCGPIAFIDVLKSELRRAGVPRGSLHIERFAL